MRATSSIPLSCVQRQPQPWWFSKVEEAVRERRKAFDSAHRSDEKHQVYISAFWHGSFAIAKAKAWPKACSSLSPKLVYYILCSVVGFASSPTSSSSLNFRSCSSPIETASVYSKYLRFHFSIFQPNALRSRTRGYLFELRQASCCEESYFSFFSPFIFLNFLV